jgi:hypothetical protein
MFTNSFKVPSVVKTVPSRLVLRTCGLIQAEDRQHADPGIRIMHDPNSRGPILWIRPYHGPGEVRMEIEMRNSAFPLFSFAVSLASCRNLCTLSQALQLSKALFKTPRAR